MSLIEPNFDEVQDQIEPGRYKVRVRGAKVDRWETERGVTPYVNWELETFGESEPKNNGRRIFHKTPTAGKGAFQLQKFYRAAMGESIAGQFDTEQLVGRSLEVEVAEGVNKQTKEPTGYMEVKNVSPLTQR